MRKTPLVCTVGPAVDSEAMLRKLILAGMNAARFNFSHGTHESHLATLEKLKRVRDELGRPIATILDTKGPEIRIKSFETGSIELKIGDVFTLTTDDVVGDQNHVSVTYVNLHKELSVGARVLIDDGLVELHVTEIKGKDIICSVESAGTLSNNKSINIPNVKILLPSLTEKDRDDIQFAVENDFDFIAASFVRKASDVEDIRAELHKHGGDAIRIISKIENQEGVNNLDEIVNVSDGIMVARGDLGVEIPAHQVPILQKAMIAKCVHQGKPVITATQMLDSMMRNPRPTRAEVSDVANAVFDGTSCVMLSGETASGKYPLEAVGAMAATVNSAEGAINYWGRFREQLSLTDCSSINNAITHACCMTAMDLNAKAILA
ncbi:MAG: pyruvate kinase, partial [Oscillospiraceae bacterium]